MKHICEEVLASIGLPLWRPERGGDCCDWWTEWVEIFSVN